MKIRDVTYSFHGMYGRNRASCMFDRITFAAQTKSLNDKLCDWLGKAGGLLHK